MSVPGEKEQGIVSADSPPYSPHVNPKSLVTVGFDTDKAYEYLVNTTVANEEADRVDLKALRRKIDYRIMPIMLLCYIMTFIDKVMINYAAVMGLNKDLKLKGNEFSNAGSTFFIAYLIADIPTGLILNKVSAAKWLSINVTLWGITAMASAAVTNYHTLLVARIFLGLFEAAISPCLMILVSQWYTKSEQAPRMTFWFCGLGFGQIFGGLFSFAFQHVKSKHIHSWQAMFIFCGALTVVFGIACLLIPDSPINAKFITDAEKTALLRHVSVNHTGVVNRHFKASQIYEMFFDPQIWLLTIAAIALSVTSGVISSYSSTLIAGLGYKPMQAALLNMPSGIVSIIATFGSGVGIRYTSNRWAWAFACCLPGIAGGALMSFSNTHSKGGLLSGIYLVNGVVATLPIIYTWVSANTAGHTKRVCTMALMNAGYSAGNIIGPQTFRAKDAPQYYPAKITVLATQAAGAVLAVILYAYYRYTNNRRDRLHGSVDNISETNEEKWANLTDKENLNFRYVY